VRMVDILAPRRPVIHRFTPASETFGQ
jgi:hypothetical protein